MMAVLWVYCCFVATILCVAFYSDFQPLRDSGGSTGAHGRGCVVIAKTTRRGRSVPACLPAGPSVHDHCPS